MLGITVSTMSGILLIVGTPIGNLGDMSPRAVEAMRGADFIAAEDTRVTLKLLNHFEIKKPMVSYFEHNKMERGDVICARIEAGETCVLVSDAGMPAISDPGELLVRQCADRGITVSVVPGPSAVISALAVSGLPTGRFTFEGFLSMNKKSRRTHLEQVASEPRTMVFYEAPHKLAATLDDMLSAWGDRKIAVVREITKLHEEVIRTTLAEAAQRFADDKARGEIVLVIEGAPVKQTADAYTLQDAIAIAQDLMENGCSASDAAKRAAQQTGYKKGEIYKSIAN